MTAAIVDHLEMIEIDQRQSQWLGISPGLFERGGSQVRRMAAIRQTRERVQIRELRQLTAMQARTHEQRSEQRDDQCARGNRQPGASLQLGLALPGLRELELQSGVAIDFAIDLESGV